MLYETFRKVADLCNLSAAFADRIATGKGLSESGKVDFRGFDGLMDKWAFVLHHNGNPIKLPSGNIEQGFRMIELLLAHDGIAPADFRWRGNAAEGLEPHGAAAEYREYCRVYLEARFGDKYSFENTTTYAAAPKRKAVAADILSAIMA